jgi:hypothetical protein
MTRITPPRAVDIEVEFPELSDHRRTCTRLHPRPGTPSPYESSVGGPFQWPADEPWPACRVPHQRNTGLRIEDVHRARQVLAEAWRRNPESGPNDEERELLARLRQEQRVSDIGDTYPVPLLPLMQLFTQEVPGLAAPEGCDLLQVLWCPFDAHGTPPVPDIHLRWRNSSECGEILAAPPLPEVIGFEGYVADSCVLHPERVVEHEFMELLSGTLQERIKEWEFENEEQSDGEDFLTYHHDLSIAPGWKVGGYATWSVTGPQLIVCSCGTPMDLLLTIASTEWSGGSYSWVPLEDRELIRMSGANTPTRVTVGRGGSLTIFFCRADPTHGHRVSLQ